MLPLERRVVLFGFIIPYTSEKTMARDYIAYSPIPRIAEIMISIIGDTFFLKSGFERYKTAARTTVNNSAFQSTANPEVSNRQ